jgi:hypothetical protein
MTLRRFTRRIACLSLLCGLVFCGHAAAETPNLGEVEAFDGFPVYYAGEEVDGLPFESISEHPPVKDGDERSPFWSLSYGDCTPPPDGGCSLPITVQSWSTCYRWFNMSHHQRRPHLVNLRGAKASGGIGGSELEIFTGRSTVVIFAYSHNLAMAAARQLRKVGQTETPALLPPPVPGSLGGKLPCQRPWWK